MLWFQAARRIANMRWKATRMENVRQIAARKVVTDEVPCAQVELRRLAAHARISVNGVRSGGKLIEQLRDKQEGK